MDDAPERPRPRLERIAEVARRVGFKKSWIYERIAAGDGGFPAPLKIGSASRWDSRAIDAWLEAQARRGEPGAPRPPEAPQAATDGRERGRYPSLKRGG